MGASDLEAGADATVVAPATKRVAIVVPYLGSATHEATLTGWHKKPGDRVETGDVVCDIATDKVDTEVEATVSGTLVEIVADVDQVVPVGEPLAWLVENDAEDGAGSVVRIGAAEVRIPADRKALSPLARRRAADRGVDPGSLAGSGARGRVRADDVGTAGAGSTVGEVSDATGFDPVLLSAATADLSAYAGLPAHVTPVTRRRRLIAEHLSRSYSSAPHARIEIDVQLHGRLAELETARARRREAGAAAPSYLTLIAHAATRGLRMHPRINATYAGDVIVEWGQVNLGVAVDTEDGLVVPVIADAGRLSLDELTDRIADVATRARRGDLAPTDVQAGTFTVSSLGGFGIATMAPVLHEPQAAILGVPAVQRQVVPVDGPGGTSFMVRPTVRLSLTFDHRVVDGADAARFLAAVRAFLEPRPDVEPGSDDSDPAPPGGDQS